MTAQRQDPAYRPAKGGASRKRGPFYLRESPVRRLRESPVRDFRESPVRNSTTSRTSARRTNTGASTAPTGRAPERAPAGAFTSTTVMTQPSASSTSQATIRRPCVAVPQRPKRSFHRSPPPPMVDLSPPPRPKNDPVGPGGDPAGPAGRNRRAARP